MSKHPINNILLILMAAPCVLIGSIIMSLQHFPPSQYLQNIVVLVVGIAVSYVTVSKVQKNSINPLWSAIISIIFLLIAYFFSDIEGVHRWIKIGPFSLNIAFIVLPVLLISIYKILEEKKENIAILLTLFVAVVLYFQPDASMLSAFSGGVLILMYGSSINRIKRYTLCVILLVSSIISWLFMDELSPVSHVEGILNLAKQVGVAFFILAIISLILLFVPFYVIAKKRRTSISICLGVFYLILIFSSFYGSFPVPLLGYGVAPVISYLISLNYLINKL